VRIAAPPERGRANRALLTLLAEKLGVKEAEVEVVAGPASRDKIVRVTGLGHEELEARLRSLAGREP